MNLNNFFPTDEYGRIYILGYPFYTDDLLIIAIIFFLYKEQVKDKMIYIALFLLLMSK